MSLQTRLGSLISAIGADIKSLSSQLSSAQAVTTLDGGATPGEANTGSYTALVGATNVRTGLAVNETGVVQTITTTSTAIPGTSFTLPQISRPQILTGRAVIKCTAAMTATAGTVTNMDLIIADELGNYLEGGMVSFDAAGTQSWMTAHVTADIEANVASHTYHLEISRGGSTSGTFQILNGSVAAAFRSALRAVAA